MSLESKLLDFAQAIGADMQELSNAINNLSLETPLSIVRSNEDANGIFTVITHSRINGTTYKASVLSGGTSPEYTTRTITFYENDGITVKNVLVYALSYSNGVLISEILQP